jgi:hypothetical protein
MHYLTPQYIALLHIIGPLFLVLTLMAIIGGTHHVSSSGHCPECNGWYCVEWAYPIEFTTIIMKPSEVTT